MRCITTTTTATNGCRFCEGEDVRDFASKQNSDSYLANENLRAEISVEEAEEAEKGMEEMSEVYRESGDLYMPSK